MEKIYIQQKVIANSSKFLRIYTHLGELYPYNPYKENDINIDHHPARESLKDVFSQYAIQKISSHIFRKNLVVYASRQSLYEENLVRLFNEFKIEYRLDFINKIIAAVDEILVDNDEFNILKIKNMMGIVDNHVLVQESFAKTYYVPGLVHVFNTKLVSYYDGKNWNKLIMENL